MPGVVVNWLVVVFDSSGIPEETHWWSSDTDADADVKECQNAGCTWVKKVRITSPVVPDGGNN
jgi:hypothetical protein